MTAPLDLDALGDWRDIPNDGLDCIWPALIAELRAARPDAARYRRIQNIAWGDGQGNWTFYMSDFVQSAAIAKGGP